MITPEYIDKWLKSHKLTQKALATALKTPEGYISNIINEKNTLSPGMASRIEKYMKQVDSEKPDLDTVKAFAVRLTEEEVYHLLQLSGKACYTQEDAEAYVRQLLQRTWDDRFGKLSDSTSTTPTPPIPVAPLLKNRTAASPQDSPIP